MTTYSGSRYYNQFNPPGTGLPPNKQLVVGPDWGDFIYAPNREGDGGVPKAFYGWGLFQLTRWDFATPGTYDYPKAKHLWNWHTNTETAIDILDQKWGRADQFERYTRNHYSPPYGTGYTAAPLHLGQPSLDVATIQGFNGFGVTVPQPVRNDSGIVVYRATCWNLTTNAAGQLVWTFVPNMYNYVQEVVNEF